MSPRATPFFLKGHMPLNLRTRSPLLTESHTPIHLPSLSVGTFLPQRALSFRSVLEGPLSPRTIWEALLELGTSPSEHSPTPALASTSTHLFRNAHFHSCANSFRRSPHALKGSCIIHSSTQASLAKPDVVTCVPFPQPYSLPKSS